MLTGLQGVGQDLGSHPGLNLGYSVVVLALAVALGMVWGRLRTVRAECTRERRGREEMEAYLRLDVRVDRGGDLKALGNKVCGVVAARSVFSRVAMLARDAEGHLYLVASEGMDDATVAGVEALAARMVERERVGDAGWGAGVRMGSGSLVVSLDPEPGREVDRAIVVPLSGAGERITGALVVCANSILEIPRQRAEEAVAGMEALAAKLGRAMENVEPVRRGRRVDRLVGRLMHIHSAPLRVVKNASFLHQ